MFFWTIPIRDWQFSDSKYNMKANNLNRVQQALFLKSWICMKAGYEMNKHTDTGKTLKTDKISPFANYKNHLDFLSPYSKPSATSNISSL